MNINIDSLAGKDKRPLTRTEIEKRLQEAGSSKLLNLAGETMAHSDLSNINLSGANLSLTDFRETNLSGANLNGANLRGANLRLANLNEANLSEADLSGAYLRGANLRGANLSDLNLSGANLSRSDISKTYLSGANLRNFDLSGTNLSGANLTGADLRRVDLSEADLTGVDLRGADLRESDLRGANLSEADLRETNLGGANLRLAYLSSTNLRGANLRGADLRLAELSGADLSGADLTGTTLTVDDLINTNFAKAILNQIPWNENKIGERELHAGNAVPALRIRIEEEQLTASHLSEVLDSFISLYVKLWLLQQSRFNDFLLYTKQKERRFEEEAHLLIAELKYNSPADIKFNLDISPKSVIEALQMLVDVFTQRKYREQAAAAENHSKELDNRLKEEAIKQEQLKTVEKCLEMAKHAVELTCSTYDEEQKALAIDSILKDMLKVMQDPTLEVSLTVPLLPPPSQPVSIAHSSVEAQQQSIQP